MTSYIRCPECAKCIGIYAEFVTKAKNAIYDNEIFNDKSKEKNYDPEKIVFNSNITPNLENIFDLLQITNRCCRIHLMSSTEFDKIYK